MRGPRGSGVTREQALPGPAVCTPPACRLPRRASREGGEAAVTPGMLNAHPHAGRVPCRTHMQNIKDITSSIHFEAYRVKRLNEGNSAMANGVEEKEPEAQEM